MRIASCVRLACLFLASASGQAASLGLVPSFPDVRLTGGALTYTYTAMCQKSNGQTGACSSAYTIPRWDLTTGVLTITGSGNALTLDPSGTGFQALTGTRSFNFRADFGFTTDGTGLVLKIADNNPDDLRITGNSAAPGFAGPNLLTGEIVDARDLPFLKAVPFGYAGTDRGGSFEFLLNALTGNLSEGPSYAQLIATTSNLSHALLPAGPNATWDSKGTNFWKNSFSATVTVDSFVPVPGAAWLLLSGFAALGALRRRS